MIEIDGSQKSGSGTILRLSVSIAAVLGEPLHIYNIRQNRPKPGLRPQHLEAVITAARLSDAELQGAVLDSRELWFKPKKIKGGTIYAEIGTAGSIPMLLLTVLPICVFADNTVHLRVAKGGTDVAHSPTINYMRFVLLPMLKRLGIETSLTIHRYGYYPKGMGEVSMTIEPCRGLKALRLETFGEIRTIDGVSVCTFLAEKKVADRQAKAAASYFREKGLTADIRVVNDCSNPLQKGSSVALWTETSTGAIFGADAIGELRKPSEAVGREAAEKLYSEISARPTVDVHLADMLVPYIALAKGESKYLVREVSDHLETNIWLAERTLRVSFNIERVGDLLRVAKV